MNERANIPGLYETQTAFAAHIRHPGLNPCPPDVEPRRMQIYAELVFNNINNFLSSAFPVSRSCIGDFRWCELVRTFVHEHGSETPFFLEISEEFLLFIEATELADLPIFFLELCHYEWVELAVDVDPCESAGQPVEDFSAVIRLSPLARLLSYRFPVHRIGPDHMPDTAPPAPTFLIVYRNTDLQVKFVESNPLTHRLLELLSDRTAREALVELTRELNSAGSEISLRNVEEQGTATLQNLAHLGVVCGE